MNHADTIFASALAALPAIGSEDALPADIQVFPPGQGVRFTLQDYPGEEFEVDVDDSTAERLNADLQNLIARSNAGQGPEPFADRNHADAESVFTPVKYFWAGDDKVKGGVRLAPNWNQFGAQLVRAKAFKYFSQNFLFSKAKKKVLGLINENVGGLVNRPGFSTQAAFARADVSRVAEPSTITDNDPMTQDDINKLTTAFGATIKPLTDRIAALEGRAAATEGHRESSALTPACITDFASAVKAHARANNIPLDQAASEYQRENPQAGRDYVLAMRKGLGPRR